MPLSRPLQNHAAYPWRDDTRCELLADADRFIPAMVDSINAAQGYILLEMYLVESGLVTTRFIDALLAAAERGVSIYILLDSFGSRQMSRADRSRLKHTQIHIAEYHPFRWFPLRQNLVRDHRKLLLVDGRVGYTGGVGLSDGIRMPDKTRLQWHDLVVRFEGNIGLDWQHLFCLLWQRVNGRKPDVPALRPIATRACSARLISSRASRLNAIYGHLRQRAATAQNRIWIATAYFLPSWRLQRQLRQAAQRGVDVRLLLPGEITDNPAVRYASQRFYMRLLHAGIRIYEYVPAFMHAKAALVDTWTSIGSSNFDRWSLSRNLEANLEISDAEFAQSIEQSFRDDFSRSEEITIQEWTTRPARQLWREKLWGALESWLNRPEK